MASKLNKNHKAFIFKCLVELQDSPTRISEQLYDPEVAKEEGFRVVKVTRQAVAKDIAIIRRDRGGEIVAGRAAFLKHFDDTPLAHKKFRVRERVKAYNAILEDGPGGFDKVDGYYKARRDELDGIKSEIGEDIKRLAEAMEKANEKPTALIIGELTDGQRRNLGSIFSG